MINLFPPLPLTPDQNMIQAYIERMINLENYPYKGIAYKDINGNITYRNKQGLLHRTDGPAIIWKDGSTWYYKNGKLHREDGPAKIYANGSTWYYKNGLRHRIDGHAIINSNGTEYYYINDKKLTEKEFLKLNK